jgi:cytochrome P450
VASRRVRAQRRCIGFALAEVEVTLIVARMAQRLDLELVDPTTPKPCGLIVNRPTGGVPVRAAARKAVTTRTTDR